MPTDTFFRLPEEKRQRLMDAAWEEFTQVRFSDASINKIIRAANIPRGSFYQYFADKDDLFAYLVRPMQLHFIDLASQVVSSVNGDLSKASLGIYDRFFNSDDQLSQDLARCIRIIRCNPESEFHSLFGSPDSPVNGIIERVDTQHLSRKDPEFIREVFGLFIFIIGSSIIDTLNRPEQRETIRNQLALRVDILLNGCRAHQGGTL